MSISNRDSRRESLRRSGCLLARGLAVIGLLAIGVPAFAWNEGDVDVGGVHLLTVRARESGMSVKQRADRITDRLRFILADPNLRPSDVHVVPLGNDNAKIRVKNRLLVTVTPEDARLSSRNKMTSLELAHSWARHLRSTLPQLNVKPNPNEVKWARRWNRQHHRAVSRRHRK